MAKINISINDELLKQIDNYAEENYLTRSGFITKITNEYFDALKVKGVLGKIGDVFNKIKKSDEYDLTDADVREIDKLLGAIDLISKSSK